MYSATAVEAPSVPMPRGKAMPVDVSATGALHVAASTWLARASERTTATGAEIAFLMTTVVFIASHQVSKGARAPQSIRPYAAIPGHGNGRYGLPQLTCAATPR